MATTRSFNAMLNEYLAYELLKDEHNKRNYFMGKVERDNSWKGGALVVPFEGAGESSYKLGGLTADTDIAEGQFVRGTVNGQKEIFGSILFNERDLAEHGSGGGDGVSEQSFLKNLPKRLSGFMDGMKEIVSTALLAGAHIAKLTADGTVGGVCAVDRPERFTLGQKVVGLDTDAVPLTAYIIAIDLNASTVTISATRGGAAVSAAALEVAKAAKFYIDGGDTAGNRFTDIVDQLLPLSAGGSANLFGIPKLSYPFLQAIAFSGASISSTNVLDQIFDAWANVIAKGRGTSDKTLLMSYKHLGNVMKKLEAGSGAYRHVDTKVSTYGYTEVTVSGARGVVTLAAVQEMRDDVMIFVDWSAVKFHTNGDFFIHKDPEGKMYYVKRATSGYQYIVDIALRGELVVSAPWKMGIIHSIP
jgi:hypothetical protein